jgi:hypothetical protein
MEYKDFIKRKTQLGNNSGFKPIFIPDYLYDFQQSLLEWSLVKGRSAIFADCGLGKTPIQLVWAENIVRKTNKNVLILAPLAVSFQTIKEGEKFGIKVNHSIGKNLKEINITNYERLHNFNPEDFTGVICDESSILKSFNGSYKSQITEFMKKIPYRLLCTATAAPNDYIELGTSSEAIGELGFNDMLNKFFINDQHVIKPMTFRNQGRGVKYDRERKGWRFKGHGQESFWKWVCSWARACRKPSDLGFNDNGFILPELIENNIIVQSRTPRPDMLFDVPAVGLEEERELRKRTVNERCEMTAEIVNNNKSAVIWCNLNIEGDLLAKIIPDAKQVKGSDSIEKKEERLQAFKNGELRVLITKPKIGAFGLNWQHCNNVVFFISHSYEQYYQAVRRCWRFGQTEPVNVSIIQTDSDERVIKNLTRKSLASDKMFTDLVNYMNQIL